MRPNISSAEIPRESTSPIPHSGERQDGMTFFVSVSEPPLPSTRRFPAVTAIVADEGGRSEWIVCGHRGGKRGAIMKSCRSAP